MNGCPEEQRSRQILCSHLQHDKAEHRPRPGWCIHEGLRLPGTALSPSAYHEFLSRRGHFNHPKK